MYNSRLSRCSIIAEGKTDCMIVKTVFLYNNDRDCAIFEKFVRFVSSCSCFLRHVSQDDGDVIVAPYLFINVLANDKESYNA